MCPHVAVTAAAVEGAVAAAGHASGWATINNALYTLRYMAATVMAMGAHAGLTAASGGVPAAGGRLGGGAGGDGGGGGHGRGDVAGGGVRRRRKEAAVAAAALRAVAILGRAAIALYLLFGLGPGPAAVAAVYARDNTGSNPLAAARLAAATAMGDDAGEVPFDVRVVGVAVALAVWWYPPPGA